MPSRVTSLEQARADLAERLRPRHREIEEAIFAHVRDGVPDPVGYGDAEYVMGLRAAVTAAVEYGLTGIELREECSRSIPSAVAAQACRAARGGVSLDTVLRRYVLGDRMLAEHVMEEAEHLPHEALVHVLKVQGSLLDRLLASIASEYTREVKRIGRSPKQHNAERVRKLLAGEPVDAVELGYELDTWHLGVIATGTKAEKAINSLAAELGRQVLLVSHGEKTVWAWFGDHRRLVIADIGRLLLAKRRADVSLAIGEPGRGVKGFRLTHRQAQAALLVALRRPQWLTRYADVALLAFALRDEALARSLVDIYLSPLDSPRKGSPVLRRTLRAYFAAEHNATSAASALGVARHTVDNHLRTIEKRLGRMLSSCLVELEVALRLEELDDPVAQPGADYR
jgi:hypothetical protein